MSASANYINSSSECKTFSARRDSCSDTDSNKDNLNDQWTGEITFLETMVKSEHSRLLIKYLGYLLEVALLADD